MAIRLTGLMSNMDTESIIKELMNAQNTKKTKLSAKQTKLTWKQDKWKELNTKIYRLYTDQVSKMRLQSNYKTKAVSSSDQTKVSAIAGANAATGSHTIEVSSLASAQYLTGGKLSDIHAGEKFTGTTKLSELGFSTSGTNSVITIDGADKGENANKVQLVVTENTTINDFVSACKGAGLNASFDENQQRFFISSSTSGNDQQFTITASGISNNYVASTEEIKKNLNYSSLSAEDKKKVDEAIKVFQLGDGEDLSGQSQYDFFSNLTGERLEAFTTLESFATAAAKNNTAAAAEDVVKNKIIEDNFGSKTQEEVVKDYMFETLKKANPDKTDEEITQMRDEQYATLVEDDIKAVYKKACDEKYTELKDTDTYKTIREEYITANETNNVTQLQDKMAADIFSAIKNSGTIDTSGTTSVLTNLGLAEITKTVVDGKEVMQVGGGTGGPVNSSGDGTVKYEGLTLVAAQDATFMLDGAELTSSTNEVAVNGLTIQLNGVTTGPIKLNVTNDTQQTYDMVKDFVNEYNKILKEMNDLYYAGSSKGYEPLTDEEKEAMTDDQIEKWENKIKDSILRRDDSLGGLISAMKSSLQTSVTVNGKAYTLSSFGICTSTDYTEKGLLHIYGEASDSTYASENNKLMEALQNEPEAVAEALAGITKNLYETMNDKMKASTLSSALTFYNDKQLTKQATTYKNEMTTLEKRLKTIEDRYYKQFSAMETALSKLNSQQSSLSGLFG